MEWNVALLVKDYPRAHAVQGPDFFMVTLGDDFIRAFKEFATAAKVAGEFLGSLPTERFMWVGLRVIEDEPHNAVATARHRLEGFIDATAITSESAVVPKICDVVWVSKPGAADMTLQEFHYDDWIHYVHGGPEGTAAWNERNEKFQERVMLFYQLAAESHPKSNSQIGIQLRHSVRMFRYAIETRCFGVEFICKFCALEGLVCGNATANKKQLLLDRLGALFLTESQAVRSDVAKLWKYRSEAVHTAQAFDNGSLTEGAALGVHIAPLSRLFRATVVFALDHLHEVQSVDELWAKVSKYTMPTYAGMHRPKGMEQYALKNMLMSLGAVAPKHGVGFDDMLRRSRDRAQGK